MGELSCGAHTRAVCHCVRACVSAYVFVYLGGCTFECARCGVLMYVLGVFASNLEPSSVWRDVRSVTTRVREIVHVRWLQVVCLVVHLRPKARVCRLPNNLGENGNGLWSGCGIVAALCSWPREAGRSVGTGNTRFSSAHRNGFLTSFRLALSSKDGSYQDGIVDLRPNPSQ